MASDDTGYRPFTHCRLALRFDTENLYRYRLGCCQRSGSQAHLRLNEYPNTRTSRTAVSPGAVCPTVVCLHNINMGQKPEKAEGALGIQCGHMRTGWITPHLSIPCGCPVWEACNCCFVFLIALATDTNPIWPNQLRNELQSQLVPLIASRTQRQRQWI